MVVASVRVLVPEPGAGKLAVDNFAVIPPGWPVTVSAILPLNPPDTVTLIVTVAPVPWTIVTDPGVPESVKPACGVTVTVRACVWVMPPPVAVIWIG